MYTTTFSNDLWDVALSNKKEPNLKEPSWAININGMEHYVCAEQLLALRDILNDQHIILVSIVKSRETSKRGAPA